MPQSYKKIRYMMENAAQMETIKAAYTKFRVEGYPDGYVNQPARGSSVPVSLIPFSTNGSGKYITKMSGRASGKMAAIGISQAELNIDAGTGGTAVTGNRAPARYSPAKMVVFVPKGSTAYTADSGTTGTGKTVTEDTDATPLSAVRGIKYNRRLGNSYTFPFGYIATAGQNTQLLMQGYLYIKTAKGGNSVTFKPEIPG